MSTTSVTPVHLRPNSCHVCGKEEHADTFDPAAGTGHLYWSNAEADAKAREHDRQMTFRYSSGATTVEGHFVDEVIGR